ncbi:glutamate N-acetyltransferase [Seinonella peptonophila]|uniref:Arginine biosynthesis bifunctional protein ArgJ n=1 Tax=Seinonella peptonophila TaxID=112248 RepID=A0A1M4XQZ5_9BACL|nr:bifunctional glutamate N-acetyltransferase/amino-acid acetyltransferase ArgJ [Seinonella peptonophila]SHE95786.1 glutamate N-acetyltransferase [Seinonella peptonophila]
MSLFQVVEAASITAPKGYYAGGVHAGIRKKGKLDLGFIFSEQTAHAAAVYTTNAFQAAPLIVTQDSLSKEGRLQAIVVNSGIANACTGNRGLEDAYQVRSQFAELWSIPSPYVAVASTGVIGEYLPMEKMGNGLTSLNKSASDANKFAQAILTTDTRTKTVQVKMEIEGKQVTISGVAKGSGMIHPNMATMLAFITTDAQISSDLLELLLRQATDQSFNMITVDGDCSTNDMVIAMANGLAGHQPLHRHHDEWYVFKHAFEYVCQELAKQIAQDGEGATRLIETKVNGAPTVDIARSVAKAVVGSNLVKTAIFGGDANWGRVVCAVGYGATNVDPERVSLQIGNIPLIQNGLPVPFSEIDVSNALQQSPVVIDIDLQQGEEFAIAWGCDLTYEYVKINASYRT